MPYYQLIHADEVDCGFIEYTIRISADQDTVGPDVFVSVHALSSDLARRFLVTAFHEVDSWEVRGIKLEVTDDRISSLAVIIPKAVFLLVDQSAEEDQTLFTFGCKSGPGKKGPRIEAVIRAHSLLEAVEILRFELSTCYDDHNQWAIVPIRLEAEGIPLCALCLDISEFREAPRDHGG